MGRDVVPVGKDLDTGGADIDLAEIGALVDDDPRRIDRGRNAFFRARGERKEEKERR